MAFLIASTSILLSSSLLFQCIIDYKRGRLFTACLELVTCIILIASGICAVWYSTLEMIS